MTRLLFQSVVLFGAGLAPAEAQRPAASSGASSAVLVRVEGVIQDSTVALVHRAFREARSSNAGFVVVELDTPGGILETTQELVQMLANLRQEHIKTVAFIPKKALSAGAMISLACDQIVMGPGAIVGAATPVLLGPGGIQDVGDSDAAAKIYSAVRADMRALCEKAGRKHMALLAEAMVDPRLVLYRVSYKDSGGVERTAVFDEPGIRDLERDKGQVTHKEALKTRPLTLTTTEAVEYGLADATAEGRGTLLSEVLGVDAEASTVVESSWSEDFVAFLNSIKLFLLIGGAILLYIEFTTPGFGVPGALGLLCFVLFFLGGYLVGLAEVSEILLFALGIGLLLVEFLLVPGTIVAGLAGFLCVVASLFLSFQTFVVPGTDMEQKVLEGNLVTFTVVLLAVMVLGVGFSRMLPRLPGFKGMVLDPRDTAAVAAPETAGPASPLIGKTGLTLTDLRPAGSARLDGQPVDVVADGEFIPRGSAIRVLQVDGTRVVVGRAPTGGGPSGQSGQMALPLVILILILSFVLFFASVFFPTFGVLETIAAVCGVASIFLAFEHGQTMGFLFMAVVGIGGPVFWFWCFQRVLPHTPVGKEMMLGGPTFDPAQSGETPGLGTLVGQTGTALSDLRPSGIAELGGRRIDVVTRGELLARGAALKVVKVDGNRVVVAAVETDPVRV